ncbi:MAG: hypothetical protein M1822_006100 [Bathelium mastoideum]|nr:MAG: hypothetical protein M1822_006100 [Bathelium mastoideum]
MESIVRFPDEIWTIALGHLHRKNDRKTIHALRLVDKRLHRLVDSLVYRETVSNIQQKPPPEGKNSPGPLQRLAWSVARQPNLSRFVKEIRLPRYDFVGQLESGPSPSDNDGQHMTNRYRSILHPIDLPEDLRNELLEHLFKETPLGHLSFLLTTCTDLEVLSVRGGTHGIGKTFQSLLSHATHSPSSLPFPCRSLTTLTLGASNYETGLSSLIPILRLPSLAHLTVFGLADQVPWPQHAPPAESISPDPSHPGVTFVLDSCLLSAPGLSWLLRSSCARSLTVRWRAGGWNKDLSIAEIGAALRKAGGDLEYLHFDTCDVNTARETDSVPPIAGPKQLGRWRGLKKLRKLRGVVLPRQWLGAGDDEHSIADDAACYLPSGLQHLGMLGVGEERDEMLELRTCTEVRLKGQFEELREVVLVPWWRYEVEEWYGTARYRTVDYRAVDYELERLDLL